jgi:hypothetical protein
VYKRSRKQGSLHCINLIHIAIAFGCVESKGKMDEEEHEVYGGEIPDVAEMEGDVDMSAADDEAGGMKELDEMRRRLKEMEEEAAALREMHAKVVFIMILSNSSFY